MNRQGDGTGVPEWWNQLYDDAQPDTGRTQTEDSVDDRFVAVAQTVGGGAAGAASEPPGEEASYDGEAPAVVVPAPVTSGESGSAVRPREHTPGLTLSPRADPDRLEDLAPDTVLDAAQHGRLAVRAVSARGAWARRQGRPRDEALLTARFGSGDAALLLCALATGVGDPGQGHLAAREACVQIAGAVGRSQPRLSEDLRHERRAALKSGLGRLTARSLGRVRASAVEQGLDPSEYTAHLRCLLLPADPHCLVRLFFGVGGGGLLRLRAGERQDLEPAPTSPPTPAPHQPVSMSGRGGSPARTAPFLFRTSLAEPGDVLLLCGEGMAEPLRADDSFPALLSERWGVVPPDLAQFLSDTQQPVAGCGKDRTVVGVWEPPADQERERPDGTTRPRSGGEAADGRG